MEISTPKDRIEVIDVLRGFTLLGIILVHFTEQYYAGQMPAAQSGDPINKPIIDLIISGIVGILIQGKFFMIFSFLFGLSFFIQLNKSDKKATFLVRFIWRLIVLFLIGFVHSLHYRGDILTIYAVLGFVLLLCYKLPDKVLLVAAILLITNVPSIIVRAIDLLFPASGPGLMDQDQAVLNLYWQTLKTGSYLDILNANVYEIKGKFEFQVIFGRLYITMGLFLLGLYAGRKNIFQDLKLFKRLMRYSLWTLLACVITALSVFSALNFAKIEVTQQIGIFVGGGLMDIFNAALATIYVSLIIIMFNGEAKKRLMMFYSVGRMGLTTYLMQTLVGIFLFFSIGLNQLGVLGTTACAGIGIAVFALQIAFSNFWLKHFYYGPVEWLWRSLTYLKVQPFRRSALNT